MGLFPITHATSAPSKPSAWPEQVQQAGILAGDSVDVAFTVEHNDHPDRLELRLEDIVKTAQTQSASTVSG